MALTWALWLGLATALAQTTGARPDPADPRLGGPPPATASAFAGYRSFRDEPLADWRAVNDEMRTLGGHAGHIHGAAAPADGAPPANDRATPKPAPAANPGGKHAH